ncbi:histidine protein methyltransferase 1 homolog [Haematobia irritans]|uniref:histidine protein methyltransferase 1 homolog n=1 Tax=Haematobia irritans TaxID=7368 RepID=UPI003F502E56
MFKFDFKFDVDADDKVTTFTDDKQCKDACHDGEPTKNWYSSEEICPTRSILENIDVCKLNSVNKRYKDVSLNYMISGFLLEDIKSNNDQTTTDIKRAEDNHSDLIPGVYEGGAKIWECTDDLLLFLSEHTNATQWEGKHVLDLGCGSGLLGIYAFKCGSNVTFQDYNKDVLEKITIPNVVLNTIKVDDDSEEEIYEFDNVVQSTRFYSGDWQKWSELTKGCQLYDIILTSETIYNAENHEKLLNCLCDKLKDDGKVYVAAKTYYFGVGGGLRQFEHLIEKDQRLISKSVWLSTDGVNREIIVLSRRKNNL